MKHRRKLQFAAAVAAVPLAYAFVPSASGTVKSPRRSVVRLEDLPRPQLLPHPQPTTRLNLALVPPPILSTDVGSFFGLFVSSGSVPLVSSAGLNAILFFALRRKLLSALTPEGFAHSLALGTMLWAAGGWRVWTVCVLYLFLGQAVTKIGFKEKDALGIAEGRGGRRGAENVWGSALTATLCAAGAAQSFMRGDSFLGIEGSVWILGYVSSLATKLADTFGSEIGKAYGKSTYLITSLKSVPRGTEGAVSLEGTAATAVGGAILASYACFGVDLISVQGIAVATVSAFLATLVESLIGATLQGKESFEWMTNEVVNFINTLVGAALAILIQKTFL